MGKFASAFLNESTQIDEARLIKTHTNGNKTAKVYGKNEDGEHVVKFFTDGKHHTKADYHTDDLEDAHMTAKHQIGSKNESTDKLVESVDLHKKVAAFPHHSVSIRKDHIEKIKRLNHGETESKDTNKNGHLIQTHSHADDLAGNLHWARAHRDGSVVHLRHSDTGEHIATVKHSDL